MAEEEFDNAVTVEIVLKSGEKLMYFMTAQERDKLAQGLLDYVDNSRWAGTYEAWAGRGDKRKLAIDFREVRFIG